jgi:hypothetical protein
MLICTAQPFLFQLLKIPKTRDIFFKIHENIRKDGSSNTNSINFFIWAYISEELNAKQIKFLNPLF